MRSSADLLLALDASRIGAWCFDLGTRAVDCTALNRELFGLARDAPPPPAEGWLALIHPDDRARVRAAWSECVAQRTPLAVAYRVVAPDGSLRWLRSHGAASLEASGRPVRVAGTTVDITAHRRAEEAQRRSGLLARLGDATRTLTDAREIVNAAMRVLREHLGADRCAWAELEEDEEHFTFLGADMGPGVPGVAGRFPVSAFGGEVLRMMRAGRPFACADTLTDLSEGPDREGYRQIGIRALIAVPTHRNGRLVAGTGVHQGAPRAWTEEEVELVREVTERCWESIERARAEAALREREAALQANDRRKDEFLATLAHELRNPLAPIRNAVYILNRRSPADPTLKSARDMIERQVQHLVRLIDDLLDVSRITRGKLELRREPVTLAAVVRQALETSLPQIERARHQLTVSLPERPIHLDADPVRLAQVLSNLLQNAAKYTDEGGRIWLSAEEAGAEVVIRVRDTGIGISAEHLPCLFEMFSQVRPSSQRSQGGLGIGLSLVRGLVEMHGGSISARSDGPGRGSEFTVRLPLFAAPPAPRPSQPASSAPEMTAPRRILVVDDNRDSAESLAQLLRLLNQEVATAHDGVEGFEAAARLRPDVVLLDIGMPRQDGYATCRRIREQPWGRDMVLIAQTGWGAEKDRQRTEEVGFDAHLVKPVDPQALMKVLRELPRGGGSADRE